jgi:hypothetical protein
VDEPREWVLPVKSRIDDLHVCRPFHSEFRGRAAEQGAGELHQADGDRVAKAIDG